MILIDDFSRVGRVRVKFYLIAVSDVRVRDSAAALLPLEAYVFATKDSACVTGKPRLPCIREYFGFSSALCDLAQHYWVVP